MAVLGILGSAPDTFGLSGFSASGALTDAVRAQEWWLPALDAGRAWQATEGAGITVAVLGTGVAANHPDLAGEVVTGPDYTASGRGPGGPFWGIQGTAVAGIIAGHGHGAGENSGIVGIAPQARILSVRVTLEFNDPLNSDPAITHRLPDAIAAGLRYAVDHGARVIDLPLDPGTLGLTGQGDPAAAGGSAAERAAAAYALSKNVVLVAPAGDDGQGPGLVNYPAAYPGVVAVGAVDRGGQPALFTSRRPYVSLTAPGVDLAAAAPPDGYGQISTTSMASGLVAGAAALLLARFPDLTAAQVTQALTESTALAKTTAGRASLPPLPARSASGAGYGTVNAGRAVALAALIIAPPKAAAPTVRPTRPPARPARPAAAPSKATSGSLAGSLVKYVVIGLIALIALLAALLVLVRSRRARAAAALDSGRGRTRGMHEHRRPPPPAAPGQEAGESRAGPSAAGALPSPGEWQGGGLGEIAAPASFRPAMTPVSRSMASPRGSRRPGGFSGPPWESAPPPERMPSPLRMMSRGTYPQSSAPGIRVPRDMPTARTDPARPALDFTAPAASFDVTMPPAPDLSPGPAAAGPPSPPGPESAGTARSPGDFPTRPDLPADPGLPPRTGLPARAGLPTRQSLGFAAAPVPTDYAAPALPAGFAVHHEAPPDLGAAAEPKPGDTPAAGPGTYIWDISATDVFPVSPDTPTPPPAPGAVSPDDAPGASDG